MAGGAVIAGEGIGANAPKNKLSGILIVAFAAFGGMLFGYDTGTIGGIKVMGDWLKTMGRPAQPGDDTITDGFAISTSNESLVVSILSAGTFVGALLGAPFGDILGRKKGLLVTTLIFSFGVALQTAATKLPLFNAGRFFAGVGVGLVSTLVPMYQSECAPKWIRGAVVSLYQFAITIGLLLAAIVDNATQNRPNHSSYRIPVALQFVWAGILATGLFFLPESPRWYIKRGDEASAAKSMSRLTSLAPDDPIVQTEIADIRANLKMEEELDAGGYIDCFRNGPNKILLRTLTGIFLQAFQQLTGVNFIFYYGTTFFKLAGISDPFTATIATSVVNVGMTIPGIYMVERVGRRNLLLIGAAGMCICEYIVAIVGVTVSTHNIAGQHVLIAFVCIYIAFFASTWGPIAWVVIGEIYPLNVRAKGMSMAAASNWLWNFGIAYATPFLVNGNKGDANLQTKVFFIWGSTCFMCFIFSYFCVPETKGLSLEQVDILYQNCNPWNSQSYRRQLIAQDVHASDLITEGQAAKGAGVEAEEEKAAV